MKEVFDQDEIDQVLSAKFYKAKEPATRKTTSRRRTKKTPVHYDVICISLYKEDLKRLDQNVRELKDSGHRKMSRSALIRFALDTMDTDKLPKAY